MIKLYRGSAEEAHSLISLAAKELCGASEARVYRTEGGKPYFADLDVFFSLSHSGSRAILAASDMEIGADIQIMRPVSLSIARRFFSESEQDYVFSDADEQKRLFRFYEIWTKKEAFAKWRGDGLAAVLECDVTALDFYTECDGEYAIAVYEKENSKKL